MKKLFLTLITVSCVMVSAVVQASVISGEPAPDFKLMDTNGAEQTLSQYKGKYVVLEWVNHDCPFVKKHYDSKNMQNLQTKYTGEGVIWLSINSSAAGKQGNYEAAEANKLTEEKGASPTALLLDPKGEVGKLYGAQTTPHMFIIDPNGVLIYQGAIDSVATPNPKDIEGSTNYVQQALNEAMAGKPVSNPSTKSYGCSVKY